MPIIDDMIRNLQLAIDSLWYNVLMMLAQAHWGLLRGVFMMGHTVELLNNWLTAQAFAPLIQQTGDSLRVVTSMVFVVALFVLGVTYLLASIIRLDVVSPRSAILWYLAGMVFFQVGPALYGGMNDLRRTLSSAFYLSTLDAMRGEAGSALSSLNSVQTSDLGILVPCDNFGPYLGRPGGHGASIVVNGLDVALAYLRADGIDVMGYPYPTSDNCQPHVPPQSFPIPWEWSMPGSFFDNVKGPAFFPVLTDEERAASISMAGAAQWRLLSAWPLVMFGLFEQIVGLCLTIAQGLTFISMACAILFAFFRRTEGIAWSVVDQWVELLVQTVVIALVQALVVALFLAGAATNNGLVVLGLGLVCLVFMAILMLSGVRAIWRSFNRLFDALGKATGGTIIGLGTATQTVVGAGAATVSGGTALAGNTLGGASALMQGASWAQAAGITLGGATALTSAARTLVHLPGVRDTALADVADQFVEGAVTRRVAGDVPVAGHLTGPLAGAMLLSDRRPDQAKVDEAPPMLVPAVGDVVEGLARGPRWKRPDEPEVITVAQQRSDYVEQETGEEMEQHITGLARETQARSGGSEANLSRLDAASSRLERAAETLERASAQAGPVEGRLQLSGASNVAGVMGEVVGLLRREQKAAGTVPAANGDYYSLAQRIAQVLGVTPVDNRRPPVERDLARFGLFANRALDSGISAGQTEQVIRQVTESPDGTLKSETRAELVEQVQRTKDVSWDSANREVDRLEHAARMLPNQVSAYGLVSPTPTVNVQPQITVKPEVQVTVEASGDKGTTGRAQSAALAGSETPYGGPHGGEG